MYVPMFTFILQLEKAVFHTLQLLKSILNCDYMHLLKGDTQKVHFVICYACMYDETGVYRGFV